MAAMFSSVRTSSAVPICLMMPGGDIRIILSAYLALILRSWTIMTTFIFFSAASLFSIFSQLANVYVADDVNAYGQAQRTQLWFTESAQDAYDTIFMNYSSIDWFTCGNQDTFNTYFDNMSSYFSGSYAYQHNGMVAMPYVCGGYASFAMIYYVAWMLYPTVFSLDEAQDHLQVWFDNFCCDKNNKLASHELTAENAFIYYTGSNYKTYTQLAAESA